MSVCNWIGTHNGKFHCDEVVACCMLTRLPAFSNHKIVRTRDPAILDRCDIVVDVGGIYDHQKKRYDHHQRGFEETMQTLVGLDFNTKLSSAGLIYVHYGKAVITEILGIDKKDPNIDKLYEHFYKCFLEGVDAVDNGIRRFDGEPKYSIPVTIHSLVEGCNPAWNDENADADLAFSKAMSIARDQFEQCIKGLANVWLPARELVLKAIEERSKVHPSGKIILLDNQCPWKKHFFELEKEKGYEKEGICLILYMDSTATNWRVQAIPVSDKSGFDNRISLPWKGARDAVLEQESGIPGAIFVHISGFIGAAKTKEGALMMAEKALELNNGGTETEPMLAVKALELNGQAQDGQKQVSGNQES